MIKPSRIHRSEQGMASIVVVSVLVVILTLISLGFARIMTRSSIDSTNRQLGNAANYAAQSGINDVISYMKQYAADHPSNPYVGSAQCNGPNSLIGSAGNPGPFYNDSNLSGDSSRNSQYSCLLLNQTPSDLVYSGLPEVQSQVVKMTTSAVTGALDKIMLSWKPTNAALTGYPPSSLTLLDESAWTDPINSYMPILRVTIYPVPVSGSTANLQANARTIFLYPQAPSPPNNVPVQNYVNISDGQKLPVNCGSTNTNGAFNGKADYRCNLIINNLVNSVSSSGSDPINYLYLRLTPIYGQLDVKIQANDIWGQSLKFIGVQAVVDVTAKVANVSKRLQARVNTSSGSSAIGGNISPAANDIPEFSLRSSDALCKRLVVQHGPYYDNILPGAPDNICHSGITVPTPSLTFSITGNNGRDNGLTVDSEANNPDSPQNPVQKGTVYIDSAATLTWRTRDAKSCIASGGANWSGQKLDPPTRWSDIVQADGSQTMTGITTVQRYTLSCTGPGSAAPLEETVTAWPQPVTSISGPSSVRAGDTYTISWSSINTRPDSYGPCTLSGAWSGTVAHSGSQTFTWPVTDNSSVRTYIVTCYDPVGRFGNGSKSWTVCAGGCGTRVDPPLCYASASFSGSTTSNASLSWSTSCPTYDPANAGYPDRYIDSNVPGVPTGYASTWYLGSGSVRITQSGSYYFRIYVWAPPWKTQSEAASYGGTSGGGMANSSMKTVTVYPPLRITSISETVAWDQGPECNSPGNWYDKTWWCRGSGTKLTTWPSGNPGCATGYHKWTMCRNAFSFTIDGGSGGVSCSAGVYGYGTFSIYQSGNTFRNSTSDGWINGGAVNGWLWASCSDSAGQTAYRDAWGSIP